MLEDTTASSKQESLDDKVARYLKQVTTDLGLLRAEFTESSDVQSCMMQMMRQLFQRTDSCMDLIAEEKKQLDLLKAQLSGESEHMKEHTTHLARKAKAEIQDGVAHFNGPPLGVAGVCNEDKSSIFLSEVSAAVSRANQTSAELQMRTHQLEETLKQITDEQAGYNQRLKECESMLLQAMSTRHVNDTAMHDDLQQEHGLTKQVRSKIKSKPETQCHAQPPALDDVNQFTSSFTVALSSSTTMPPSDAQMQDATQDSVPQQLPSRQPLPDVVLEEKKCETEPNSNIESKSTTQCTAQPDPQDDANQFSSPSTAVPQQPPSYQASQQAAQLAGKQTIHKSHSHSQGQQQNHQQILQLNGSQTSSNFYSPRSLSVNPSVTWQAGANFGQLPDKHSGALCAHSVTRRMNVILAGSATSLPMPAAPGHTLSPRAPLPRPLPHSSQHGVQRFASEQASTMMLPMRRPSPTPAPSREGSSQVTRLLPAPCEGPIMEI
eukprot:TRINITY_DN37012_c0_g1_i1.p1 TRINITY_DN37012_c0_g1~~TRINITY_DN37012_c0_g1_i1.p1  ORF type:complete len:523 (+),score=84.85 TRINITY_DN37012_c0_g1_i1:96-1571(+)